MKYILKSLTIVYFFIYEFNPSEIKIWTALLFRFVDRIPRCQGKPFRYTHFSRLFAIFSNLSIFHRFIFFGKENCCSTKNHQKGALIQGAQWILCFFRRFYNIPDSCLSLFALGVSVCTHTRQVEHQTCSRTGRVKKNHKNLRKKTQYLMNPIFSDGKG